MKIQKGESFIYKSKYGGVVIDTIREVRERVVMDFDNRVSYIDYLIVSSKGICYDVNEIYVVKSFLSQEFVDNWTKTFKVLREKKKKYNDEYRKSKGIN